MISRARDAALCALGAALAIGATWALREAPTDADLAAAATVIGLELDADERAQMRSRVEHQLGAYTALRRLDLDDAVAPAVRFDPLGPVAAQDRERDGPRWSSPPAPDGPLDRTELAWRSVGELGALLRAGQVSSVELTERFLERLRTHGRDLEAVITLTEATAHEQAARADRELRAGLDRGPLHGIPYGAKDLFAVPGYPTTWGAAPFRNREIDQKATAIARLEAAGAVLLAKLSVGSLAWGDVWYGGRTRSPWSRERGSSGSSAGSATAVAAGLLPFALGTETLGSIVSPAERVGVTGLRPSFGAVSRHGVMTLAWSMDKVGVLCRHAEDCALAYDAIRGPDGLDPATRAIGFAYSPDLDLSTLRIGYLERELTLAHEERALDTLRGLGARLVPIESPALEGLDPRELTFALHAEAAAAFDALTRSGQDDELVRQTQDAWPNVLRAARLIPAVEYLQAQRARSALLDRMRRVLEGVDLYLAPSTRGTTLSVTNLTGHPCVTLPTGQDATGEPTSLTLIGRLADEETLLAVAHAYQRETPHEDARPPGL